MEKIFVLVVPFLLGSIPFGLLFSRWLRGVDPREHGSGNIGFTNVLRAAGWLPGTLTLIGDMGKGYFSVWLAKQVVSWESLVLVAGWLVVLGHNYSIFLNFKGGKGVATGFGVLLGIDLVSGAALLGIWVVVVGLTRISSLGAIVSFGLLPVVAWITKSDRNYLIFAIVLSFIILVRHRSNILRLWRGVEPKIMS